MNCKHKETMVFYWVELTEGDKVPSGILNTNSGADAMNKARAKVKNESKNCLIEVFRGVECTSCDDTLSMDSIYKEVGTNG